MKPIPPHHVQEGGDYWASWGSKGWTAVRVLSAKRKWAQVERMNPRTNETKSRKAKVRIDELVKRDPKKKGKDKPQVGPAEVFATVRTDREAAKERKAEAEVKQEAEAKSAVSRGAFHGWAPEKVDNWLRERWDSLFGEGSYDEQPTIEDW